MSEQIECYVCGGKAMPSISFRGPHAYDDLVKTKHFCTVHCFWQFIDNIIASRDKGGRLDMGVDWSGKSRDKVAPGTEV